MSFQDIAEGTNSTNTASFAKTTTKTKIQSPTTNHHESEPGTLKKLDLTLILIDHYDSFTYNLYDMLSQLCERPPIVLAKDAFDDWSGVLEEYGSNIDGIILSPGPGTPTHPEDIGFSPSAIQQNPDLPILGVCLGHQILGHVYGAEIYLCGPVHGQVRAIEQETMPEADSVDPLWKGIPAQIHVTRYHSLAVRFQSEEGNDGDAADIPLRATAFSVKLQNEDSRILMGMSHTQNPHYGVQFHPESIGSDHGYQLLRNFCNVCNFHRTARLSKSCARDDQEISLKTGESNILTGFKSIEVAPTKNLVNGSGKRQSPIIKPKYQVFVHKVKTTGLTPLQVYEEFLSTERFSVWLDTSMAVQSASAQMSGSVNVPSYSSILGAGQTPIEYYGKEFNENDQGLFQYNCSQQNKVRSTENDILSYLQEEHKLGTNVVQFVTFDEGRAITEEIYDDSQTLPFTFRGGHVGYLGYEVWRDSIRYLREEEQGFLVDDQPRQWEESLLSPKSDQRHGNQKRVPTAAFLFLDKSWVYDHSSDDWYLIGVVEQSVNSDSKEETERKIGWLQSIANQMVALSKTFQEDYNVHVGNNELPRTGMSQVKFLPNRSRSCYNQNFADCIEQIHQGESYELCLTNQLEAVVVVPGGSTTPLDLYKLLRRRNPAPFSAFLNWNTVNAGDANVEHPACLALCCSSPERFLSVKPKMVPSKAEIASTTKLEVEAKPIKGTRARVLAKNNDAGLSPAELYEDNLRAQELQASVKNRAENLMIVDLLRNDLSRVCESGSVHVSNLMDIESYATVHQMVSTIRGTLDSKIAATPVDVLKAAFPGGSMTGAPKIRTVEILDRLEQGVSRGPYSGSLGYISLNGAMDMNIIIRSAVLTPAENDYDDEHSGDGADDVWQVSIGAGGAITALSESEDEYEEMILKASAVMKSVEDWVSVAQRNL